MPFVRAGPDPMEPAAPEACWVDSEERSRRGRRARTDVQKHLKEARPKVTAYESFCRKLGEEPADVALAWLLHNPAVTAPIIGPRTLEQLEGSLRALRIRLGKAELARLDTIWPGPGGEAPEAYAW